jgi:phospholipase D1/2
MTRADIRIASYNVHSAIGRDRRFDPQRIATVLEQFDAQVVGLQEVRSGAGSPLDMLGHLQRQTGSTLLLGPTLKFTAGEYGNALLVRLPVASVDLVDLSVPGHEPRGAIDAVLRDGEGSLRVIVTHLGLNPGERRLQIRMLLERVTREEAMPTVLMGDLNEWFLWGRPLRWLRAHFEQTPAPATFPSAFPLFALDRIWVKPRHLLRGVAVHASPQTRRASDHLPIVATLAHPAAAGANDGRSVNSHG